MSIRVIIGAFFLATCNLTACAPVDGEEDSTAEQVSALGNGLHWGDIMPKGCSRVRRGYREWSAILWGIPWGDDWRVACRGTFADDFPFGYPDRCDINVYAWGVWYVRDSACGR